MFFVALFQDLKLGFDVSLISYLISPNQGEDGKSGLPGRDGKPGKEVC